MLPKAGAVTRRAILTQGRRATGASPDCISSSCCAQRTPAPSHDTRRISPRTGKFGRSVDRPVKGTRYGTTKITFVPGRRSPPRVPVAGYACGSAKTYRAASNSRRSTRRSAFVYWNWSGRTRQRSSWEAAVDPPSGEPAEPRSVAL